MHIVLKFQVFIFIFTMVKLQKIFEDCYGKENVKQWHHEVKQAVNKCRNESDDQSTSSAFTYMMDMFKRYLHDHHASTYYVPNVDINSH